MRYSTKKSQLATQKSDCLIIPVYEDEMTKSAKLLDKASKGALVECRKSGDMTGKLNTSCWLTNLPGVAAKRILLIGCGEKRKCREFQYRQILATAFAEVAKTGAKNALCCFSDLSVEQHRVGWKIRQAIEMLGHNQYQFTHCKSDKAPQATLKTLSFYFHTTPDNKMIEKALQEGKAVNLGIAKAKELGNLPANICTPSYLAKQAQSIARRAEKLTCKVLNEAAMEKLGMHSLLSVSRGSVEGAKLIVMQYNGAKNKKTKPIVLVGKGITFDSGGISLKGGAGMDEMKFDMCGAASVIGTLEACADLKLNINVVGVVAASENMPSGRATKPGDVVTSMSGKTIEILNTDAEGRLVLCDALTYCKRFDPDVVIDLATLTGAMIVALGHEATGVMGNSSELVADLIKAGQMSCDRAWQLPLWEEYKSSLQSNFADLPNIGNRAAGSIVAGCFLSHFTEEYHWAHMDIAGTAWNSGNNKGATGRPVSLLMQYLINRADPKQKLVM